MGTEKKTTLGFLVKAHPFPPFFSIDAEQSNKNAIRIVNIKSHCLTRFTANKFHKLMHFHCTKIFHSTYIF